MRARFDFDRAELLVTLTGSIRSAPCGPKSEEHPTVGVICAICGEPLRPGQRTRAVALGPSTAEDQRKHARGEAWDAVACEVHEDCTGEV